MLRNGLRRGERGNVSEQALERAGGAGAARAASEAAAAHALAKVDDALVLLVARRARRAAALAEGARRLPPRADFARACAAVALARWLILLR